MSEALEAIERRIAQLRDKAQESEFSERFRYDYTASELDKVATMLRTTAPEPDDEELLRRIAQLKPDYTNPEEYVRRVRDLARSTREPATSGVAEAFAPFMSRAPRRR